MHDGLNELDRWLVDRMRTGLADPSLARFETWDALASRLVDARAGSLANRIRRLAGVVGASPDWHERVLDEIGLLHLLSQAGRRLGALPEPLADRVATTVGWQVRQDDVLAGVPDTDDWIVAGRSDTREDRIEVRRFWLYGTSTNRWALALSFAAYRQSLDESLQVGTSIRADLHRYPGEALRALIGDRFGDPTTLAVPPAGSVLDACGGIGAMLVVEPWLDRVPAVVRACADPYRRTVGVDRRHRHAAAARRLVDRRTAGSGPRRAARRVRRRTGRADDRVDPDRRRPAHRPPTDRVDRHRTARRAVVRRTVDSHPGRGVRHLARPPHRRPRHGAHAHECAERPHHRAALAAARDRRPARHRSPRSAGRRWAGGRSRGRRGAAVGRRADAGRGRRGDGDTPGRAAAIAAGADAAAATARPPTGVQPGGGRPLAARRRFVAGARGRVDADPDRAGVAGRPGRRSGDAPAPPARPRAVDPRGGRGRPGRGVARRPAARSRRPDVEASTPSSSTRCRHSRSRRISPCC